jgi:DNA-binding winged helix-turn-helix (wHTH) protein/TolB-like protein/Tfp pilus assembly protein PilF
MTGPPAQVHAFGPFRVDVARHQLFREGEPVAVTPKAIHLLAALIERRGQVVEKEELMRLLWPDTIVEEANLTVTMSTLRRALGESPADNRFIVTVPGRGYRFVAHVDVETPAQPAPPVAAAAPPPSPAPRPLPATPIAIVALVAAVSAAVWWSTARSTNRAAPVVRSIAVLPFRPVVQGTIDELTQMGTLDTLVTRLSRLPQIVVRPTSATRRYWQADVDPIAAGRDLQVESVLDGTFQRAGDRVRITVRLIRVPDGAPIWSDTIDEQLTDLFTLQDAVSARVASALVPRLSEPDRAQLAKRYTTNHDAYQAYVTGRSHADQFTRNGSLAAIADFKQAIALDPDYALAWAGLADAYIWFCIDQASPREMLPQAEAAAERAVALDNGLGDAHGSLATIRYRFHYDWLGADAEFRRALAISANDPFLHQKYGWYLSMLGRLGEARTHFDLAQQLNPLSVVMQADTGVPDYAAGRYDAAMAVARRTVDGHPRFATGYFVLGLGLMGAGRLTEALDALNRAQALDDTPEVIAHAAIIQARLHAPADARRAIALLQERSSRRYVSPATIGLIYAALGERDAAFEWLAKGYEDRSWWMIFMRFDARFDNLRGDPRFLALERQVGLADDR